MMRLLVGLVPSLVRAEESGLSFLVYAVLLLYVIVFGYLGYRGILSLRTREVTVSRSDLWRLIPLGVAVVLAVAYMMATTYIGDLGELPLTHGGPAMANPLQASVLLALVIGLALFWWWEPRQEGN